MPTSPHWTSIRYAALRASFMRRPSFLPILWLLVLSTSGTPAAAQTADTAIEKYLSAIGGREALGKLTSRRSSGTVTLSAAGQQFAGTVEILLKTPNKSRALITLDLSAFGGAPMTIDQRFDGTSGYVLNSVQGTMEVSGNQLENMRNNVFPTLLLDYKAAGAKAEVLPNDKLDGKDVVVLLFTPRTGSASRLFFDAETNLLVRSVTRINSPQAGGDVEQTTDVSDYRPADGVKVPYHVVNTSPTQTLSITLTKVEHNVVIDDTVFLKK
jgi:hypothetical protein